MNENTSIINEIKESFMFYMKNFLSFIFLSLFFHVLNYITINLYIKGMFSMYLILCGIELCMLIDNKKFSLVSLIKNTTNGFLIELRMKSIYFLFVFIIWSVIFVYKGEANINKQINVMTLLALGLVFLTGFKNHIFTYQYVSCFKDYNKRNVILNIQKKMKENFDVKIFLNLTVLIIMSLSYLEINELIFLVFPFICCLIYRFFNSIFK